MKIPYKTRIFMFSILFLSKIKRGTKIKNISKTFQKTIDNRKSSCYIVVKQRKKERYKKMRLWHYELLPYLPELQFKGQLRELVAIMHDWKDKGKTNHLLINQVMLYPKNDLVRYFIYYESVYHNRYGKWLKQSKEFLNFDDTPLNERSKGCFDGWHTKEYLRSNMANLWEKHFMGVGKSRITDEEWETLCKGYKEITGEEYVI